MRPAANIVDRTANLGLIEQGAKNKLKWAWLEEKDVPGDYLSDYIRKLDIAGQAYCEICKTQLKYSSCGKKDLKAHSKSAKHIQTRKLLKTNQSLPACMSNVGSMISADIPETSHTSCTGTFPVRLYIIDDMIDEVVTTN